VIPDSATTHPLLHADGFTHVRIIIGMVLGLSLARLINGGMQFVQHPELSRIYPVHLGWVIFVLISIIHFWWFEFYLSPQPRSMRQAGYSGHTAFSVLRHR
jgi:hypothetical protein